MTTMMTIMTRMTMTTLASQLWDLRETWGFHQDIINIKGNNDGDNDDSDKDTDDNMSRVSKLWDLIEN